MFPPSQELGFQGRSSPHSPNGAPSDAHMQRIVCLSPSRMYGLPFCPSQNPVKVRADNGTSDILFRGRTRVAAAMFFRVAFDSHPPSYNGILANPLTNIGPVGLPVGEPPVCSSVIS